MNGTATSKIHCPNCQKPLISQVALAEGSRFVVRCGECRVFVKIIAGFKTIEKKMMRDIHDVNIIESE